MQSNSKQASSTAGDRTAVLRVVVSVVAEHMGIDPTKCCQLNFTTTYIDFEYDRSGTDNKNASRTGYRCWRKDMELSNQAHL